MKDPAHSPLFSGNAAFIESLYEKYLNDRTAVSPSWRAYFDTLHPGPSAAHGAAVAGMPMDQESPPRPTLQVRQVAVLQLINAYRFRGHRQANLDPLGLDERSRLADLALAYYGLTEADLETVFNAGSLYGPPQARLRDILKRLASTYCATIGAEYMHITATEEKRWIQERLESVSGDFKFAQDLRRHILERLVAATGLEEYLHRRYVGQKRFSLEGGESLIALLDQLIEQAASQAVKEVLIGMTHRGRLNVLVNTLGVQPQVLFEEFEDRIEAESGSGDVKYHKGFSADLKTSSQPLHVALAFNPSHLEIIDPVVAGSVRARQDRRGDWAHHQVLAVLIHGDAAFAGQGVVMETCNLSQTRGYGIGGTVHIVINNQIGFTTSDPREARSTLYATDVAKMVEAPIFHVNADDPEAVVFITQVALDYRMRFKKDVVIDLVCYRRYGHSEADEPAVTQPVMYQRIRAHPSVRDIYAAKLMQEGLITQDEVTAWRRQYQTQLERNQVVSMAHAQVIDTAYRVDFRPYLDAHWTASADTVISREAITELAQAITQVPADFALHPTVKRIISARRQMATGERPIDWGFAELLAYGALLKEGYPVRLSGQDSARGTFFHRHAVVYDQQTGRAYVPLSQLRKHQPPFSLINSSLSEEAVLGFEYGYSSSEPDALVIWEAQYGDFANGAQVIIDQFISSSEVKWRRLSGIVLFLPHGFEGQGPEHSSARLERFLQLCAEDNIQVIVPSAPAQLFHALRRQVLRPYRKPLVVMTPKSLLRHKLSVSTLEDVTQQGFQTVLDEVDDLKPARVTRLIFCAGKVYYDLLAARREHGIADIALVRIEQLYPYPAREVRSALARYGNAREVVWVQEEPRNQGAWYYMQSRRHLKGCLGPQHRLEYAGRPYSASPAAGYPQLHKQQQEALVTEALQLQSRALHATQVAS